MYLQVLSHVVYRWISADGVWRYVPADPVSLIFVFILFPPLYFLFHFLLSIFSSISFSLSSLPLPPLYFHSDFLPPLLPLFQNRSNLSVECVQVCTYSGHRDGVWQVSHARNGLPVIGSASAGTLYTTNLTPRLWTKSLSMKLVY